MLALERIAERVPVALVLPARIRHHPIEVVEHARDQQVLDALRRRQRRIDGQVVFLADVAEDGLAVADRVAAVDDVGKLAARRFRGVEDMLVGERYARKLEEREYLQAVAVVVGDAEQRGVGVKRQHAKLRFEGDDRLIQN